MSESLKLDLTFLHLLLAHRTKFWSTTAKIVVGASQILLYQFDVLRLRS
jgi:hypothetical protein